MRLVIIGGRQGGHGSTTSFLFSLMRCGIVWLALLPSLTAAADILVATDREPVSLNESFTLIFSSDEEPDGEPDFGPLDEDFQVVRQGKSTQVTMVNGRLSRRAEWKLTVMAKRSGTLTVPPIAFGGDRSKPFTLTVVPGTAPAGRTVGDERLMIEVEAEPKSPYVQAQVLYTIRVLHRIALRNGQLDDPKLIDAVVQKLGEDHRYQTERNGQLYGVIERRFAIFPQKSGVLRIEPIHLEAELAAGPGSMFDEFFGRQARIHKIQSEPVVLQVRPVPASFKGKHWLPAGKLQLEERWSSTPPETPVGEPITRTLSVSAEGVTMGMVPELADKNAALPELQRYPDQPVLNEEHGGYGLTSLRREKTAFIPMKDGEYRIPGIELPWWNTKSDRMEVARVPERVLKATPVPQLTAPDPGLMAPAPAETQPHATPDVTPAAGAGESHTLERPFWFWLAGACGLGWLATAVAWWWTARHREPGETSPQALSPPPDLTKSLASLKRAVAGRDLLATRRALFEWSLARWPDHPPANLEQLAARLGGSAPLEIVELNRALYGEKAGDWSGEALVRLIADASKNRRNAAGTAQPSGEGLAALYKS